MKSDSVFGVVRKKNSHVLIGLEREEILVRPSLKANPRSVSSEKQDLSRI